MRYTIQNEKLTAVIDSHGFELVSLVRNADGSELIWQADPAVWKRHAPVLFPVVGKLADDRYRFGGKVYEMHQHGFARDREFSLVSQEADRTVGELRADDATKAVYPFDFVLRCGFALEGNSLRVSWDVTNAGKGEMYFSIGGHPAFIPEDGKSCDGQMFFLETENGPMQELRYQLLENGGVGEKVYTMKLADGRLPIDEKLFANDALIIETDQPEGKLLGVTFVTEEGARIAVETEAPVLGLWGVPKAGVPFVCIEPWYGRADGVGFAGELSERKFGNALAAGESFKREYTITVPNA
ncbi:MAG: aldose 1-epimerase family protein [Lachnospiraceae bacterium]|jgi:galactose mutarotase-like enzyme